MAKALRIGLVPASLLGLTLFASIVSAAPPSSKKDDSAKPETPADVARKKLSEKGIKVTHSGLSLLDEKELAHDFAEANALKRKLIAAAKQQQAVEEGIEAMQADMRQLRQMSVVLNTQIANAGGNIVAHNQLAGQINANNSEVKLLEQRQEESKKEIDSVRKVANVARESYVGQVAEIRTLVDRLTERYTALKADADAQSALAEWNEAANTKFEIKPSSYFLNSVKKLEQLEKTVVTERIPLRREGNSLFATVVINSKPPEELVLDTGASSMVLPYKVALECGIKPDESSVQVTAVVADGSKVKSKLVVLDSVRVGKFKAERVECVVLPAEATNAPSLLGMTFLSRFNFSIEGTELVLSKIEGDHHASAKPKKTRTSKTPRKSRKTDNPAEPSE
jgi:clan AA aspartic protease (TIGR02281 family)